MCLLEFYIEQGQSLIGVENQLNFVKLAISKGYNKEEVYAFTKEMSRREFFDKQRENKE